jgi:hypothetical protein
MLRSGGDIMMYLKLATALSPVIMQVYGHHISPARHENGDVFPNQEEYYDGLGQG